MSMYIVYILIQVDLALIHYFTLGLLYLLLIEILDNSMNNMNASKQNEIHSPFDKILFREFLNYLLILSYYLNKDNIK
jgi:hypothetical protein